MTFEEDFPSLNLKVFANYELKDLAYTKQTMEALLKDIQEHCLDKAKVKGAIEKARQNHKLSNDAMEELCEELGL